jgi:hypothetical protein
VRNTHQPRQEASFDDFVELSDFADSTDFACLVQMTECAHSVESVKEGGTTFIGDVHAAKFSAINASI